MPISLSSPGTILLARAGKALDFPKGVNQWLFTVLKSTDSNHIYVKQ